jgi:hypothetical protein
LFALALTPVSSAWAAPLQLPEGRRFCVDTPDVECLEVEKGRDYGRINGMAYRLYGDGSGIAEGMPAAGVDRYVLSNVWHLKCKRDSMTDLKSCIAHFRDFWIYADERGRVQVMVGTDHFPGSISSIRVGQSRFDSASEVGLFTPDQSAKILELMTQGTPSVTRYMKWPSRSWVDKEFEPYGVSGVVELIKWAAQTGK